MSLTLCPKVNLGSSHFAKSGIHRRFLEIAMEKNLHRHLDFMNANKHDILTQPAVSAAVTLLAPSAMEKKYYAFPNTMQSLILIKKLYSSFIIMFLIH